MGIIQKVITSAEQTSTKNNKNNNNKPSNESTKNDKKHETNSNDAIKNDSIPAPTPMNTLVTTSKEKTQTSKETTKTKTSEDGEEKKPAITPPITFSADVLAEAGKGVKRDNIENEYFDPSFFKNQVAMRQHDPQKRPKPLNREILTDQNAGDESNVIRVIAKEVHPVKDKLCYITVKQSAFLGAGAFSGMLNFLKPVLCRTFLIDSDFPVTSGVETPN
uniref:Uncharacterized protein n=1 Tax=Panagrolaimus superbus TaxID=310955 RepID=A0A914YL11_9BILA